MAKPKILIVDDDRLILSSFAGGLSKAGYEAVTAESAEPALQLCREAPPDMVLLDIRMPGTSGMEVAKWLRENTDIPFVFLSAYDDHDTAKQAAEYGALGYLVKPVDMPQVIAVLESALARARDIRTLRKAEADLTAALSAGREVSTAIGVVMERYRLTEKQAFEALRIRARSRRHKIQDIANEVIQAGEALNWLPPPGAT